MTALRGDGLGPPSAPPGRVTGHPAGAVVAEIGLLRPATRIGMVDSHRRAFTLIDFVATVVTDEHRLASHDSSSFSIGEMMSRAGIRLRFYAALRARRIRHERSKLTSACSSGFRPVSRALTTRKWRGRKSSIVRPSRYCSTTAGLT